MRRFIDSAGYYVTDEPSFMEKEHAMTEELAEVLGKLHMDVVKKKSGTVDRLLKLIKKHPRNPQLKNLLTSYYFLTDQQEKAYDFNRKTVEAHPDYFFGRLNLVSEYVNNNNDFEKAPELLGYDFDLAELYPDRDTFHVSEAMGMAKYAVMYFAYKNDFQIAQVFIEQMKDIDEDDFEVENAEEILSQAVLEHLANEMHYEDDFEDDSDFYRVQVPKQKPTTKTDAPVFNHEEIKLLYDYDLEIPFEEIQLILDLPRESLIEDLAKMLNDGIERFSYFENDENEEEKSFFVIHAINLLAELGAEDKLVDILNVLKQSNEFLDFYFGMYIDGPFWQNIYKLGKDKLDDLQSFLKEPGVSTTSKILISLTLKRIGEIDASRRAEVIQSYSSVLNYFIKADREANVLDSDAIAFVIADIMDLRAKELLPAIVELYNLEYVALWIAGEIDDVKVKLNSDEKESYQGRIFALVEIYESYVDDSFDYIDEDDFDYNINEEKLLKDWGELDDTEIQDIQNSRINDEPFIADKKVGRNEPCPCGSGKKYKKCCL
ncbi:SEC-C metal-binding domain-containing protein [Brumimicrobium oceani]|uniref:SEC-C metal-binding domain-containing protein n=1 Tax=Brumimicrobium oceani TaxID=2100725 RepID=UPI0018EE4A7E|nr:SEC-C metal-binding domain-containing protein [Brumimicrobium oceani]